MGYVLPRSQSDWSELTNWHKGFPWVLDVPADILTDYLKVYHSYGTYTGDFRVTFREKNSDNTAFWALDLEHEVVNEIDCFETATVNGKRGIYFSIYHTSKKGLGYAVVDGKRLYNRFQTRLRNNKLMNYLSTHEIDYSFKWTKNYVIWYIANIPVAISFSYIPENKLHLVISNL